MVRTGARANALLLLMNQAGFRRAQVAPPAPRLESIPSDAHDDVIELFEALGGRTPLPTLRPGPWDLAFADGLVVELDEELHFNRYRARTLQPQWAIALPWRDVYLDLCTNHEQECLGGGKWGKRWTNPSCESMFGPPAMPGVLEEPGSPRWKQRALYDAIKDIEALHTRDIRLCRVSVWDAIGDTTLGDALAGAVIEPDHLAGLIARRTH